MLSLMVIMAKDALEVDFFFCFKVNVFNTLSRPSQRETGHFLLAKTTITHVIQTVYGSDGHFLFQAPI